MRLWESRIIPYLPDLQLVAQWRELNSVFKKQDKHILINYIYEYPKSDLYIYAIKVIREMKKRGIKIKSFDNMINYFEYNVVEDLKDGYEYDKVMKMKVFDNHHNDRYLLQCFYNLQEKFDRGQKGFTKDQFNRLDNFIVGEIEI